MTSFRWLSSVLIGAFVSTLAGCGYGLQSSRNPLLESQGVKKIYVRAMANQTHQAGVDGVVGNQVLKRFISQRRLIVVNDLAEADAVLTGSVASADFSPSATVVSQSLFPAGRSDISIVDPPIGRNVAVTYIATLNCQFTLSSNKGLGTIWSGNFTRSKHFPGSNQLGAFGSTSAVTNQSEFERAIGDLAKLVAIDAHEDLFTAF